ncbi:ATP-binding protein [Nonomuraea angiospora]|uniref:ATP-binding protein n=1 Tax=Nonomuraea angiospora TaxID=46172 RepID=UPI00332735DE
MDEAQRTPSGRHRHRPPQYDQETVQASRIRLARVLINLLANAERHASAAIDITVSTDPPDAALEVTDDGPGISLQRVRTRRWVRRRPSDVQDRGHRDS